MEQDVLLEITMDDNITLSFESLLVDMLDYSANLMLKDYKYFHDIEDYKEILNPKDIIIQFRRDNSLEANFDGFNVAVYAKGGSITEWEYLDNITTKSFVDGTRFI